ncbi:MerR family transcriptional regulator [Nonomuraea zeae]|uniref:MerR family transcriptional regulator n=1 Tax=Nonomuraea zeae TaxID=1642303 RepID=A0A5S4FYQ5_9ACTN|nr:MerR family transcriptional regulator [Nonomuraea zeae]
MIRVYTLTPTQVEGGPFIRFSRFGRRLRGVHAPAAPRRPQGVLGAAPAAKRRRDAAAAPPAARGPTGSVRVRTAAGCRESARSRRECGRERGGGSGRAFPANGGTDVIERSSPRWEGQVPLRDDTFGIGDLARLTGVPVRTIRFYCDEGIIESVRSTGNHRRFDSTAVERLGLVRRLRGLGLGLSAIALVLAGERTVGEIVAAERAALDLRLADLSWRRAALRAVEEAGPAERADRLELLAAVEDGVTARDALVDFWRRTMVAPVSPEMFRSFVTMAVPEPPPDPTPPQVVAYAELVGLVTDRSLTRGLRARSHANTVVIGDEDELMWGVGEACALVEPLVLAGEAPREGPELDRFVAAHATVRRSGDTPAFRRELLANVEPDRDPRMRRYWRLVGEVSGEPATLGATHLWLTDSLERSLEHLVSAPPGGPIGGSRALPPWPAAARPTSGR